MILSTCFSLRRVAEVTVYAALDVYHQMLQLAHRKRSECIRVKLLIIHRCFLFPAEMFLNKADFFRWVLMLLGENRSNYLAKAIKT